MSDTQAQDKRADDIEKLAKKLASRKKPFTVDELASHFQVQPNTVRTWLRQLDADKRIEVSDVPKVLGAKGRPAKQYTIASKTAPKAPEPPAETTSED